MSLLYPRAPHTELTDNNKCANCRRDHQLTDIDADWRLIEPHIQWSSARAQIARKLDKINTFVSPVARTYTWCPRAADRCI